MLKMNTGSLVGAWLACLLGAAFEEQDYGAHAEVAMDRDGITGHADLFITRAVEKGAGMRAEPALIVEFKFSAWTGKHDGPKPYHLIQAAQYARMVGAPQFIVIQYYPATQARFDKEIGTKVSEPHIEPSQVYETKDFVSESDSATRCRSAIQPKRSGAVRADSLVAKGISTRRTRIRRPKSATTR